MHARSSAPSRPSVLRLHAKITANCSGCLAMNNPPDAPASSDPAPSAQPSVIHVGPSRAWLVAFLVVALLGGAVAGAVAGRVASRSSDKGDASVSVASVAPAGGDAASAAAFAMPSVVTIINESAT